MNVEPCIAVRLLIVDLLAERHGFGRAGVAEIVRHFQPKEVYLWSPHVTERLVYEVGEVVSGPVEADVVVITGSRRNVSSWEPWMNEVAALIQTVQVPLYGICFGHQIIAAALGGRIERASHAAEFVAPVTYHDGRTVHALFSHQDHVVDAGELVPIAHSKHCGIVACMHPNRPIKTVQFHPEITQLALDVALQAGEMSATEWGAYDTQAITTDVSTALLADS